MAIQIMTLVHLSTHRDFAPAYDAIAVDAPQIHSDAPYLCTFIFIVKSIYTNIGDKFKENKNIAKK